MPRPPLAIGTHGAISTKVVRTETTEKNGRKTTIEIWRSRTRYRDVDGVTREVTATGTSEAKATRELLIVLRDRATVTGDVLKDSMTVAVAAAKFITMLEEEGGREDSTVRQYARLFENQINPLLGSVRLRELSAGRCQRVIDAQKGDSTRKKVKVVLGMLCDAAVRDGAMTTNPVRSTKRVKKTKKDIRVLDVADLEAVRRAVRRWMERPRRGGPKPTMDMPDIVDLMLATACRIGEVLAVRWEDIDGLWDEKTVVRITGTVKKDPGAPTWRKPTPKSDASERGIVLPPFAVDMLQRRKTEQVTSGKPNDYDAVFPTRTGKWHQVGNIERRWRQIRKDTGFEWVTPHIFRKTILTLIDRVVDIEEAARLGGHGSSAITKEFYVPRDTTPVDVAHVIESFAAPKSAHTDPA